MTTEEKDPFGVEGSSIDSEKEKNETRARRNISLSKETDEAVNEMYRKYKAQLPNKSQLIDILLAEFVKTYSISTHWQAIIAKQLLLHGTIRIKYDY